MIEIIDRIRSEMCIWQYVSIIQTFLVQGNGANKKKVSFVLSIIRGNGQLSTLSLVA